MEKLLLCRSCGSYRHLLADCPDSWENNAKRKATKEKLIKPLNQSNKEKIRCTEESGSQTKPEMVGVCSNLTVTAEFMAEIETVKKEIRSLKDEIQKIKADKDRKLKTQADLYEKSNKEQLKLEEEKEKQEQQTRIRVKSAMEELHERIFKLERVCWQWEWSRHWRNKVGVGGN